MGTPVSSRVVAGTKDGAKRGAFIVLEGIDRTGKSTQVKRLQAYLASQGASSVDMRFPDRTTATGSIINDYLSKGGHVDDRAIHLIFSANRWESAMTILEHLSNGTHVICDRYAYSGVAFTAAKGLDIEWCKNPDRGLPRPDAVFYLDLTVTEASKRGGYGTELYEKEEVQRRVQSIYENELFDSSYWHIVSAAGSVEDVEAQLTVLLDQVISTVPTVDVMPSLLWIDTTPQLFGTCSSIMLNQYKS